MENPFDTLKQELRQDISLLNEKIDKLLKASNPESENTPDNDLVTPKEACQVLGIAPSTLWRYKNQGRIKCYGISGKRFYKRSELIEALTPVNS